MGLFQKWESEFLRSEDFYAQLLKQKVYVGEVVVILGTLVHGWLWGNGILISVTGHGEEEF